MANLLEAFANENLPTITHGFSKGSLYRKKLDDLVETEEQIYDKLGESDKKLFKNFSEKQIELNIIENTDRFIRGFCLGTLLMIEIYGEQDRLLER